jgi:hypothetical protein
MVVPLRVVSINLTIAAGHFQQKMSMVLVQKMSTKSLYQLFYHTTGENELNMLNTFSHNKKSIQGFKAG